jgi:hypothetical protein
MSAVMREFISGAVMKIPQYSKSIQNQIQAKGLHVNFSQAYLYTGLSMGVSGMISQLNKTTFASLG